jgi:hypothetical protein
MPVLPVMDISSAFALLSEMGSAEFALLIEM